MVNNVIVVVTICN